MHFLCICPTYGRPKHLIDNAIWCFHQQTHPDATLWIDDDLGNLRYTQDTRLDRVVLSSRKHRSSSLPEKYQKAFLDAPEIGLRFDAVAIWDDDDLYLPRHLEFHRMALEGNQFSKPSTIYSTYTGDLVAENATGRFWGSCAMRRDVFLANLSMSTNCDYDQQSIAAFSRLPTGDPCKFGGPQYVYRWGETQAAHASGYGREDWYTAAKPQVTERVRLESVADPACRRWYPSV